jgi:hypothetical protein
VLAQKGDADHNPPSVILIVAYVGLSPTVDGQEYPAKVTVYADAELRDAAVIKRDDILHWELSNPDRPAAPTLLWLKSEARTFELNSKSVRAWFRAVTSDAEPAQPEYIPVYPFFAGGPSGQGIDGPPGPWRQSVKPPCRH